MKLKDTSLSRSFVADIDGYAVLLGAISMTRKQKRFVAFCINAMLMLGCLNFSAFAVASFGYYGDRALSWMFHHSNINWTLLLRASILKLLIDHKISRIHIVIDDTDRSRSKVIKILWGVFKTIDKATGGWINAQNIVFLCLVTDKITVPFMFCFYRPDPAYSEEKKRYQEKKPSCRTKEK